jgi:chromosome segregation ATPase
VDDLIAEKGDEASSSQALSEKNQAKWKEIFSLLQRDVQDQVKDADLLREVLELIDQDLPADIKASLETVSKLDNHFLAVKQALKKLSSQPALEQQQAANKQSMKDLHIQMQNHKELLIKLQPELELKRVRKAKLEAELRTLTTKIEADEKKMAELPESMVKIQKEATTTMTARNDMHTPASSTTPTTLPTSSTTLPTSTPTPTGPITSSRAKKIQQEVHALLCELKLNSNDNFMLPKSCMLILLRYIEENHQDEGHEARIGKVLVIQQGHSAISRFRQSIRQFSEA